MVTGLLCSPTDSGVKQGLQVPLSSPSPVCGVLVPYPTDRLFHLVGDMPQAPSDLLQLLYTNLENPEERQIIFLLYGYT